MGQLLEIKLMMMMNNRRKWR